MRLPFALLALTAFAAVPLAAQEPEEEAEPATILMISSYQCPQSAISDIAEDYDTYTRPIEEELVEEGVFTGAGLFFHWWADEWNVNYFRTGHDLNAMMEGIQTVTERAIERNPELEDEPGPFAVCTAHKDGIYNFGPGTGRPPIPEDVGG